MPVIQIRMTSTERAEDIIEAMVRVLKLRHGLKIRRRAFIVRWGQLRRRLSATAEYQAFRTEVIARDSGQCRKCGARTTTVHHRRRVSRAPRLAILVSNGELRCDTCHARTHPWMKEASDGRR